MERRYQVFVSSTFTDLEDARREVSTALLKTNCFPAGMELFPAADEEQFEFICQIIRESDYYIVISAGKYGSTHPETGISYTEMEYDYALEIKKPIIRLLHRDPFNYLPGKNIEETDEKRNKLLLFREKLQKSRLVNFWNDPGELGQQVILGLIDSIKRCPTPGWVRGENALTVEVLKELDKLRKRSAAGLRNQTPNLVKFDDLRGETSVLMMASNSSEVNEDDNEVGLANINNTAIAEAVLLALINNTHISGISTKAGDILTESFDFPKKVKKYKHYWLDISEERVMHFLHYLEYNGLVSADNGLGYWDWSLSPNGRRQAIFISSVRNLTINHA